MSAANIVLAQPRGFCAGVRRAIGIVERALDLHGAPVYVRKEIVHNHYIVSELQKRGAVFVDSEEEVPEGAVCVFSAHGVSPGVRAAASDRQLDVIDATCPLVSKVHQEAVRFARDGRTILLVGHEGHEEIEGVLGEAPDRIVVIETEDDVRRLGLPDDTPVAVLTQTTLSFDETERVVEALRARFTDLITPGDDICYASQNRQNAVKDLARDHDLVLIVGSRNSSNSLRMVEVARDHGAAAHLVPDAQHFDADWLRDVSSVGISAGASAPEILVDGLVARLTELGFDRVEVQRGIAEDVVFAMPGPLADPVTGRVPRTPLAGEISPAPGGGAMNPPPEKEGRTMPHLEEIRGPEDLRTLSPRAARELAPRIRRLLVDTCTANGGHLGPNLGVVELSIALHRVFDSPRDRILWDTGHQAYVHKILTGRTEALATLRRTGGMSGYPCRAESEHDVIENSHASTALSWADGLARADALLGRTDRAVVAVVGDGALTGGMAWEALNSIAAAPERPVVVVLNDNGRSYAPTVGAVAGHLADLRAGHATGALFENLGLAYVGPVDGHDIEAVETALRAAVALHGPVVVHCVTEKGRGHLPAEQDDTDRLHTVRPASARKPAGAPSWTSVFGDELADLATDRPDVVALTAAMLDPTGLGELARRHPERVIDVGIAEQHAVTTAAGLALGGVHPVVALYATFLNRAFDQLLMDVALHRAPVTFVLDRAGVTGEDGPSHNGMWDLSLLNLVPGLRLAAPRDATTLRRALREAVACDDGPTAVRFPKGSCGADIPAVDVYAELDVLHRGERPDLLLVSVGAMAATCLDVAERLTERGVGVTVVDPRWIKPVPTELTGLALDHLLVATVEDSGRIGGAGARVAQALSDARSGLPVHVFGIPQRFLAQGSRADVLEAAGLTPRHLTHALLEALPSGRHTRQGAPVSFAVHP